MSKSITIAADGAPDKENCEGVVVAGDKKTELEELDDMLAGILREK